MRANGDFCSEMSWSASGMNPREPHLREAAGRHGLRPDHLRFFVFTPERRMEGYPLVVEGKCVKRLGYDRGQLAVRETHRPQPPIHRALYLLDGHLVRRDRVPQPEERHGDVVIVGLRVVAVADQGVPQAEQKTDQQPKQICEMM